MATNILTPTQLQYRLPKTDKQKLLASMPCEIQYPHGIVPDSVLQQSSEYFPALQGQTNISKTEMIQIMTTEVEYQKAVFVKKYGNIFG
ncbi:hypothetical protein FERRO_06200 [Ferrovum sp. JA12]|uniref:hypothetical protein n=1 Tax=Ferrovum sp. JA12 TaxID=1356299 RepID=UPI000702BBAF|nr:hypothetical protein [Ferrovum sp. JA12]KRH79552.1 hypothetical protein FERRO_06200 [Ferrovum sp. JA12]